MSSKTPSSAIRCSKCDLEVKCQACDGGGHLADSCPFLYTKCVQCGNIMRLLTSHTSKNPNRKFLKCTKEGCRQFEWLDRVSTRKSTYEGCFKCGGKDHWMNSCAKDKSKVTIEMELNDFCKMFDRKTSM